jgi:hypothetical protein
MATINVSTFALVGLLTTVVAVSNAQTIYENDFESPNQTPVRNCGFALDATPINVIYGREGFQFQQTNTVETVLSNDPIYTDPLGLGGNYSLGMLSAFQNDMLALTFDSLGRNFIQVEFDMSSIDVSGCGGPFGVNAPMFRVSLYDSPGGVFSFGTPGELLDESECTGTQSPDAFTFEWRYCGTALRADGTGDGFVTVVWDLIQSGYGSLDNLEIIATDVPTPTVSSSWSQIKSTYRD